MKGVFGMFFSLVFVMFMQEPVFGFQPASPMDPFPHDPLHYQNNPELPVQETLSDCYLFSAQTWQRKLDHWTRKMDLVCKQIAHKRSKGFNLSDSDTALENALLEYEKIARDWAIENSERNMRHLPQGESKLYPKALVLRSGFFMIGNVQNRIAEELGLLEIMESLE